MNQKLFYVQIVFCISFGFKINAQNQELNCNSTVREAIVLLKGKTVPLDSLKAVEHLTPCVEHGNPYAQLLMARLYLHSGKEELYEKGFKLTKQAAQQDLGVAATDLGDLFKYGIGCEINYGQAKKWYKKAHKLGDAIGTYSLGYMYYKGLGVAQDYQKAIKYFKASDYPMAKHWLGVANYFGYGMPENKQEALKLLGSNTIENSAMMLDCMEYHLIHSQAATDTDYKSVLDDVAEAESNVSMGQLLGEWKGALIQMDWSRKQIEQTLPVALNLAYDENARTISYILEHNKASYNGIAYNEDNTLYFEGLTLPIKRQYFNAKDEQYIDYEIPSGNLELKTYNNKIYLTVHLESYIAAMKEPGSEFILVLTKSSTKNGRSITEEATTELAKQTNSFIKLYPNPFKADLYIAYTLDKPGFVRVEVSDLHATRHHVVEQGQIQAPGDHTYYFNGTALLEGMNVITVYVDGQKHTKLIIKE